MEFSVIIVAYSCPKLHTYVKSQENKLKNKKSQEYKNNGRQFGREKCSWTRNCTASSKNFAETIKIKRSLLINDFLEFLSKLIVSQKKRKCFLILSLPVN